MNLHSLRPAKGSIRTDKRKGRGQGSGRGGTSTRGHKGAQSRSGYKRKAGFEGGQMPLQRRVPKRGFKNAGKREFVVFNLGRMQSLIDKYALKAFDHESLHANRLVSKSARIKVLGVGELKSKIEVKVHAASAKALEGIEKSGSKITLVK
jgi:large subunit ribosomal protein L15